MENLNQQQFFQYINGKTVTFCGIGRSHMPLIKLFRERGAVVSARDKRSLEELGENGSYRYSAVPKQLESNATAKLHAIFRQCVVSCDYAQNIVVMKTMPALASAACSAMDSMNLDMIVGTLAGDDTAFIVMRDTASAAAFCADIKKQLS